MQNLWSDSDAKAAIAQHAAKGIGEDLALRVYTTRLLGGEPRLVLHGGGNTSVKTKVADITGAAGRRAVRQGQRLGHGHDRGARPAGGASRAVARAGRPAGAVRRGHGQRPALQPSGQQVAQSVGRDAAARLPAAQVHRPHPFQRRAGADRPARRRGAGGRRLRQARRPGALRHAGLRARQEDQRGLARQSRRRGADPAEARHLLDGRHGGRGLCAHDRPGDAGGEAAGQGDAQDLPRRVAAREDRGGGRRRADPARVDLAAGQGRRSRGGAALRLRVPHQSRRSWPMSAARRSPATASRGR